MGERREEKTVSTWALGRGAKPSSAALGLWLCFLQGGGVPFVKQGYHVLGLVRLVSLPLTSEAVLAAPAVTAPGRSPAAPAAALARSLPSCSAGPRSPAVKVLCPLAVTCIRVREQKQVPLRRGVYCGRD